MSGWVEKYPKRRADRHIDVHLLRHGLTGPVRWRVVLDLLEADRVAVLSADVRPVVRGLDRPVEQRALVDRV